MYLMFELSTISNSEEKFHENKGCGKNCHFAKRLGFDGQVSGFCFSAKTFISNILI